MLESGKESHPIHHEVAEIRTMPEDSDGEEEEDKGALLSLEAILPDELLQKVLSLLPIANVIKLGIVCKRWYEVVHSYPLSWAMMAPQKPLFLMFCMNDCAFLGHVYDPCLLRWYNFGFPRLEKSFWRTSSSCGLVCLMNTKDGRRLLVGNPIKSDWKLLPQVPGGYSPHYNTLALSFDRRTRSYTVVVAKCTHLPGNSRQWHFSVHIYESTTQSWATPFAQDIGFWMSGEKAVICDGVFYCFLSATRVVGYILAFDLTKPPSSFQSLIQASIRAPDSLACHGLINLSNKLVMVGMTESNIRPRKGVVILELEDKTWREVSRMPINNDLLTYDFICCGAGNFLFMHCLWRPELRTFDMRQKMWKWSSQHQCACPYTEAEPFQFNPKYYIQGLRYAEQEPGQFGSVLNGFCFEPRLDVYS